MYYIYYLPNAVRDYGNGKILYGKIGCCIDYHRRVVLEKSYTRKFGKLDITGHHVLETVEGTKEEAEAIEKIWQNNFILIDGPKLTLTGREVSAETREKHRITKTGNTKHSDYTKEILRLQQLDKPKPKVACIHCGFEASQGLITRWHNDNCPHKPV